jgi:hypothetical protein
MELICSFKGDIIPSNGENQGGQHPTSVTALQPTAPRIAKKTNCINIIVENNKEERSV